MSKYRILYFTFLATFLFSCNQKEVEDIDKDRDYEMDMLNDILPVLIPADYPCIVMPAQGPNEDLIAFENRLHDYYNLKDSIGRKVIITPRLEKIDSTFLNDYYHSEKLKKSLYFTNLSLKDRTIDSSLIREIENTRILLTNSEPFDCFTFGEFTFSRVGFNDDYTKATFHYRIYDGTCFIEHGVIVAEFKGGKWRMIKRNAC